MFDHELMRLPHICSRKQIRPLSKNHTIPLGARRVEANLLCATRPIPAPAMGEEHDSETSPTLRELLLGVPLRERSQEALQRDSDRLSSVMRYMITLLPRVYGEDESTRQVVREWEAIASLPAGHDEHMCKRACILFALYNEVELRRLFHTPWCRSLIDCVLPLLMPRFLKLHCQQPEHLVVSCIILAEMWHEEEFVTSNARTSSSPLRS